MSIKDNKFTNKILVVGHPLSNYDSIMDLLYSNGINHANPLKEEGINAADISNILIKAHTRKFNKVSSSENIEQLEINQVWDRLAMDLMLSNINQSLWGWADSNAISLLNYWQSLDSNLTFVLVYDTPENFINKILEDKDLISEEDLQKSFDEWCEYNKALLRFFYRHPESSILVNTQQVEVDNYACLKQINEHIDMNLNISSDKNNAITSVEHISRSELSKDAFYSYLARDFLWQSPKMTHIYEELQSVANLPLNDIEKKNSSIFEVLTLHKEKNISVDSLKEENIALLAELFNAQEKVEYYYLKNKEIKEGTKLYGAAERIRSQLRYRMGEKVIEHSHSYIGYITMPFSLFKEAMHVRKEQKRNKKKLPNINTYEDADEAKKVRKELPYILGKTIADYKPTSTLFGIFKLPKALRDVSLEYKKGKMNV